MDEFLIIINWRNFFQALSLLFNLSGAILLIIPLLRVKQDLDDDLIIQSNRKMVMGEEKHFYTRRGFLKDMRYGLWGLGLLGLGFLIQFILVIL